MYAYCWQTGLIGVGKNVPDGSIKIMKGKKKDIINLIYGTCRLAYNNKEWLIPGIPESNDNEKIDALIRFLDWLKLKKNKCVEVF